MVKRTAKVITKLLTTIVLIGILTFVGLFNTISTALDVTSITPYQGPVEGGTEVTIEGDFSLDMKWKQISASSYHTCAIASNDQVYCWGQNTWGQLGDGTTTNRNTPVAVQLGERPDLTVKQISAGYLHTCAIASNDQVYCWGSNGYGQLGDGTTTQRNIPVAVQLGDRPDLIVKQITAGDSHTCAIASNDQVYCWGYNGYGQLGDGTGGFGTNKYTPVAVQLGDRPDLAAKQIAAGNEHTCTIASNDQVYCWGSNGYGQLGVGTDVGTDCFGMCHTAPIAVQLGDRPDLTVKQISAGYYHTCAIASNDQAYCWGSVSSVIHGTIYVESTIPIAVALGSRPDLVVKQVSGKIHVCTISGNDQAYCWGDNSYGELGDGTTTDRYTPVLVDTSSLPSATYSIVMDAGGTPAPCEDVEVASDGLSLTCTTTAHSAGIVNVTVSNGASEVALTNGYKYIGPAGDPGDPESGDEDESVHWKNGRNKHPRGNSEGLTLIITEQECSEVDSVTVNGQTLEPGTDYTASCIDDETHITLTPKYLDTLDPNTEHDIVVSFENGDIVTNTFSTTNIGTPNTSLFAAQTAGLSILGLVMIVIVGILVKRHAKTVQV